MIAGATARRALPAVAVAVTLASCGGSPGPQTTYDHDQSPQVNADHGCIRTPLVPSQCGQQARDYCNAVSSILASEGDEGTVARDLCARILK